MPAIRQTMRFLMQSLALALVGYWASEALFWGFPPVPGDPLTLGFTLLVYAVVIAAVLSAAQVTGARGGAGLVLGGALFGFLIEGVIVDTMMWSVPITLVWVPLAWHMPLSVLAAIAAVRRGGRWLALAIPALIGGDRECGIFPDGAVGPAGSGDRAGLSASLSGAGGRRASLA